MAGALMAKTAIAVTKPFRTFDSFMVLFLNILDKRIYDSLLGDANLSYGSDLPELN